MLIKKCQSNTKALFVSILSLLLYSGLAQANGVKEFGDGNYRYDVHYSAFSSSFLDPKIAQHYGIQRSKANGVVNIAVRRKREVGTEAAVSRVGGTVKNLLGQARPLEFTEVREGDAIYYIAQFRYSHKEILKFELELLPDMRSGPHKLSFSSELFHEGRD